MQGFYFFEFLSESGECDDLRLFFSFFLGLDSFFTFFFLWSLSELSDLAESSDSTHFFLVFVFVFVSEVLNFQDFLFLDFLSFSNFFFGTGISLSE